MLLCLFNTVALEHEMDAHTQKEYECMAKNIYHEARGEPTKGMVAVANVVLNRMNDEAYPDTVCGVVYQKNQFSWVHTTKHVPLNKIPDKIKFIALEAVVNNSWVDVTNGALFFHAANTEGTWNKSVLRKTITIGNHVFYKHRKGNR